MIKICRWQTINQIGREIELLYYFKQTRGLNI